MLGIRIRILAPMQYTYTYTDTTGVHAPPGFISRPYRTTPVFLTKTVLLGRRGARARGQTRSDASAHKRSADGRAETQTQMADRAARVGALW